MQPDLLPLSGNTFPVRSQLKDLGGSFDPNKKIWMIPAARIEEARRILPGRGQAAPARASPRQAKTHAADDGAPEVTTGLLADLIRAQLAILQNETLGACRWDEDAENRIQELSKKLSNHGGDASWAEKAVRKFKRKLKEHTEKKKSALSHARSGPEGEEHN